MIIAKTDNGYEVKILKESLGDDFDIFDRDSVTELIKNVLKKIRLKNELKGFLDTSVYVNSKYGMIMEIEQICDYAEEIDISVHFHLECIFLCEIDLAKINKVDCVYYYDNKFYGEYDPSFDSGVIYKDALEIIDRGIKVK